MLASPDAIRADKDGLSPLAAALRGGMAPLCLVADALPHIVWSARADGTQDYANSYWREFTGADQRESLGAGWLDFVHPEDRDLAASGWTHAITAGGDHRIEYRMRHVSGAYRWVLARARPILNEEGAVERWLGTCTDIHDGKLAQDELKKNEERYRALAIASASAVWVTAADGTAIAAWHWDDLTGQDPEKAIAGDWVNHIHPEDRASMAELWAHNLAHGLSSQADFRLLDSEGNSRWVTSRAVPVRNPDATIREWVGTVSDIDAQRRTELALRESEAHYRHTVAASPQIFWLADTAGLLIDIGPGWTALTGMSREDSLGSGWERAAHPDDWVLLNAAWAEARHGGTALDCECRMWRAQDRAFRWMRSQATARLDDKGGVVRWYGSLEDIHERKLAEEALRRSEEGYRLIARAVNQAIWELDLVTGVARWNEGLATLFGYAEPEPASSLQWWFDHIDAADRNRVLASFQRLANGQAEQWDERYRFKRADGSFAEILDRGYLQRDGSGRPFRLLGAMQDITEWSKAASHIAFQASLLDAVNQAVMATDLSGTITYWNKCAERLYGWTAEEAVGMHVLDATSAADKNSERGRSVMAYLAAGNSWASEFLARRKDGTFFSAHVSDSPVHDDMGRLIGIVGISYDTTQRKEAEAKLQASESRYRLLAENATDMISRVGLDGVRRYVSPACREILGYQPGELIGKPTTSHVHEEDVDTVRSSIDKLIAGEVEQVTTLHRMAHKTGRWVAVESHRRLVRDDEGKPAEVISIARDVTERLRLEDQLRKAQRLEAVGQLTGGVAHDFNNLLTVILGNVEIMLDRLEHEEELRGFAEMALSAAERGAELTAGLLAFARKQSLAPKPIDVHNLLVGMHRLLRRTLNEDIGLFFKLGAGTGRDCFADAAMLESAILNLCLNARDAMPDGGEVHVETATEFVVPGRDGVGDDIAMGDYVAITVTDNGTGMTQEVLDRALEPFFTTKEVGKGSGLGLSMVYGFIAQSNGFMRITSEPGQGTSVKLYLPMAPENAKAPEPLVAASGSAEGETILLVEDDPAVLSYVNKQLKLLGYHVATATDGPAALAVLRSRPDVDLLFTDVIMPGGMNGSQLAAEARRLMPDLPVLFTSGYTKDALISEGRLDEGVQVLHKPYRRSELAEAVQKACGVRPKAKQGRLLPAQ